MKRYRLDLKVDILNVSFTRVDLSCDARVDADALQEINHQIIGCDRNL